MSVLDYSGCRRSNVRPPPYGLGYAVALPKIRKHGMTIKGAPDTASQEQTKQYIYPCHSQTARFGNPAFCIKNKVLTSWISDLRSKMTIQSQTVLDTASQEYAKLESSLSQGKGFNPYPSPLTEEGERG